MNDAHRRWGPFGSLESAVRAFINDLAKEIDAAIAPNSVSWVHLASQQGSEDATRELIAAGAQCVRGYVVAVQAPPIFFGHARQETGTENGEDGGGNNGA